MALAGGDRIVAGQAPTPTATTAPGVDNTLVYERQ
jgi:hypothetical protein